MKAPTALRSPPMGRWPKAFRAFVRLTDRLLDVPRETVEKRLAEYRDQTAQKARKRGPKRKKASWNRGDSQRPRS